MDKTSELLSSRLLRKTGLPEVVKNVRPEQFDDARLLDVLSPSAPLFKLYEGALHGEGRAWQPSQERLVWSVGPNRRLLGWHPDGRAGVLTDGTWLMNGNAVEGNGTLGHCEHGRSCIRRGGDCDQAKMVTHYQGKRINSPNEIAAAPVGAIWFTDPTFGIIMPNQGALAEPKRDRRNVHCLDPPKGEVTRPADFEQPNGLVCTTDGATLYVSDTSLSLDEVPGYEAVAKHEIVAFDVGARGVLSY